MKLVVVFLCLWISSINAQGGGSFRCHPCWRSGCRIPSEARSNTINVPNLGQMTCGEAQDKATNREFFPDECSWVQSETLKIANPCECPCEPPTLSKPCQMCAPNEIIGDPEFVIRGGVSYVQGFTCGFIFDNPTFISEEECPLVAQDIQQQCKCRALSEPTPEQCVPQEVASIPCHPGRSTNRCCEEFNDCVHRQSFPGVHVCSAKGNQPWTGQPYTGAPPAPSPPQPPAPTLDAPPVEDCREVGSGCNDGEKCIETTAHGWRCVNILSGACMKSARSSSFRGGASKRQDC